jgi:hypothetical protein
MEKNEKYPIEKEVKNYKYKSYNENTKSSKDKFQVSKSTYFHDYFCRNVLDIFFLKKETCFTQKIKYKWKFLEDL